MIKQSIVSVILLPPMPTFLSICLSDVYDHLDCNPFEQGYVFSLACWCHSHDEDFLFCCKASQIKNVKVAKPGIQKLRNTNIKADCALFNGMFTCCSVKGSHICQCIR